MEHEPRPVQEENREGGGVAVRTGNEREVLIPEPAKEKRDGEIVREAERVVREAERQKEREEAIRR